MTSGLHLLQIGIAVAVLGGVLYWAFTAWSRSHDRHREEQISSRQKYQAWNSQDRIR
jgi:hypothetical protein